MLLSIRVNAAASNQKALHLPRAPYNPCVEVDMTGLEIYQEYIYMTVRTGEGML